MKREILALAAVVAAYAVAEALWLWGASGFYSDQFSRVLPRGTSLGLRSTAAAVLVYPLLLFGFWFFVLKVKGDRKAWRGLAFGAVVYGVYNLTNLATLPGWSWTLAAVDTAWGAALFAALAALHVTSQSSDRKVS